MCSVVVISFVFKDNGSMHGDLVLSIGGTDIVCDTYYLALDQQGASELSDAGRVRVNLAMLLRQWLQALSEISDGGTVYLPYDFSDEYTGWLACQRSGLEVSVSVGWALVEGWALMPPSQGDIMTTPKGFRVDGPIVRAMLMDFVESVRGSLALVE